MLSIVLVLLVATSALAAPTVEIDVASINEVPYPRYSRGVISSGLIQAALEAVDGGDVPVYSTIALPLISALADSGDAYGQRVAVIEAVATIIELAYPAAGLSRAASNVIAATVSGNSADIDAALGNYIRALADGLDGLSLLINNPAALRNIARPAGYTVSRNQLEAAWNIILANASAASYNILEEQSCSARRLSDALNPQNNGVGAQITVAALPQVQKAIGYSVPAFVNLLGALASGADPRSAVAAVRSSL